MSRFARHIFPVVLAGAVLVSGCARDSETSVRAWLAPWFTLQETLDFAAQGGCAAGAFRLGSDQIRSGIPVEDNVIDMLRSLPRVGVAGVDDPNLAPDDAMIHAANAARTTGMAMRRISLEARPCLEGPMLTEFKRLLTHPKTVFVYESDKQAVIFMDRANRVLVVAMGGEV